MPSPTREQDRIFRKEVDKYLNGYSMVMSSSSKEDILKLNNATEVLSDFAQKKRLVDRYNLTGNNIDNPEENEYSSFYIGIRDSQSEIGAELI